MHKPAGDDSWEGPYLKTARPPADSWGRPYVNKLPGEHGPYDVASYGPAGPEGGAAAHLLTSEAR